MPNVQHFSPDSRVAAMNGTPHIRVRSNTPMKSKHFNLNLFIFIRASTFVKCVLLSRIITLVLVDFDLTCLIMNSFYVRYVKRAV